MKNVILCKNFKNNYFYYAPDVDTIFLVTIRNGIKYSGVDVTKGNFYILEWLDKNDVPEMRSFSYSELEHDKFIGVELGEL